MHVRKWEQTRVQTNPHPLHTFSNQAWDTSRDYRRPVFSDEGLLFASTRDQDEGSVSTQLHFVLFLIDESFITRQLRVWYAPSGL